MLTKYVCLYECMRACMHVRVCKYMPGHTCVHMHMQGRIQVLRKGGSNIFDAAKYIGALEVGGRGCCMYVNPPSFVQRRRHFGD